MRRAARLLTAVAAAATTALTLAPAAQAATPRTPGNLPAAVEEFPRYQAPTSCAAPRPGTLALRQLILDTWGRQTVGTARACPADGRPTSEHHDGRAVDWMLRADVPAQAALAREFTDWLLAPDARGNPAANARRLGVMYVIWNRQVWKAYQADRGWQPYTGASPHTDHVHVSLTFSGAAGETSWWSGTTDAITAHWARLGGNSSTLGAPVAWPDVRAASGVQRRRYAAGSVYAPTWGPVTAVSGAIAQRYDALGGLTSLGVPVTDPVGTPRRQGAYNHFEGGSIYWSPATGAHDVRGAIREQWGRLGWENGALGFPTTDDARVRGGWSTHFQGGSVYFSPATGAHEVRGAIRDAWARLGWEAGGLGFPTTGDLRVRGGWSTHFQGGSVYASPTTGAHAVRGAIRDRWASLGWETSRLGFPVADERPVPGGVRLDFQGGAITWDARTGATTVS